MLPVCTPGAASLQALQYSQNVSKSGGSKQSTEFCTRGREWRESRTLCQSQCFQTLPRSSLPYGKDKDGEIEWSTGPEVRALSPARWQTTYSSGQFLEAEQPASHGLGALFLQWSSGDEVSLLAPEGRSTDYHALHCLGFLLHLTLCLSMTVAYGPPPSTVASYPWPDLWLFLVFSSPGSSVSNIGLPPKKYLVIAFWDIGIDAMDFFSDGSLPYRRHCHTKYPSLDLRLARSVDLLCS
jgi:hypothetical protein